MTVKTERIAALGLSETEMRERLAEELVRSMHIEGDRPTVHAIAHSVARVLHENQLRMADQLESAGIRLRAGAPHDA